MNLESGKKLAKPRMKVTKTDLVSVSPKPNGIILLPGEKQPTWLKSM